MSKRWKFSKTVNNCWSCHWCLGCLRCLCLCLCLCLSLSLSGNKDLQEFSFSISRKVKSLSKCIFQIVFVKLYLSKCIFSCLSISLVRCLKDQKILHSKVRKLATKIASRQNSVNFDKNYLAAKWRKLWEK